MSQSLSFVNRLLRNDAGNVLPIAAAGVVVGLLLIGSAVDMSRNYMAREQLQSACDAGVLAGRRTVTSSGLDQASKAAAETYFRTNFKNGSYGSEPPAFETSSEDSGNTVFGRANLRLNSVIMGIFGYPFFDISVSCSSSMGVGNADVMMVLDTTGSMDGSRIVALRAAMKNFYTTVEEATKGGNARIRYGFVPYSSTTNVGRLLYNQNPDYLKNLHTYQSRLPFFWDYTRAALTSTGARSSVGSTNSSSERLGTYSSSSACSTALNGYSSGDWVDTGTPVQQGDGTMSGTTLTQTMRQTQSKITYECVSSGRNRYLNKVTATRTVQYDENYTVPYSNVPTSNSEFSHWEYRPVERDTSQYKTFASTTTYTGRAGASVSSSWGGCIEERKTVNQASFSYSSALGITPSDALDVDIDLEPNSDLDTKWAPLWNTVTYSRTLTGTVTTTKENGETNNTVSSPITLTCPKAAQGLQEMSKSAFNQYADDLTVGGNTYLDIGIIWGGRLISPDGMFRATVNASPTNGGEVSRHLIFMTDGVMQTHNGLYTAWGIESLDRRVTVDGSRDNDTRHTERFKVACEAVKGKGIRLWVIAFGTDLISDLRTCASDESSFRAANSGELDKAFQEIAKQVGELRIVQ